MEINGKDVYFVAVKALLRKGDELLITHDIFGSWDIPGGRIKKDEFEKPLEQVLARKLAEELGGEFQYKIDDPKVFFRVERLEAEVDLPVRIFAIGYEVQFIGGEIQLGEHHDRLEWVKVSDFKPEDRFEAGWAAGLQEYLKQ
jgi:8-oxo-dGTP pyrophosphatase MutT (NUDIX family)